MFIGHNLGTLEHIHVILGIDYQDNKKGYVLMEHGMEQPHPALGKVRITNFMTTSNLKSK